MIEQNKERLKRNQDKETSGTTFYTPTFTLYGVSEGEKRQKEPEKIFEEIIAENFPNMGQEIVNQVQEAQSPRQDKPKEAHTKIHNNQTEKN